MRFRGQARAVEVGKVLQDQQWLIRSHGGWAELGTVELYGIVTERASDMGGFRWFNHPEMYKHVETVELYIYMYYNQLIIYI